MDTGSESPLISQGMGFAMSKLNIIIRHKLIGYDLNCLFVSLNFISSV